MGAVRFPTEQIPIPNLRFHQLRAPSAADAAEESASLPRGDAVETATSASGGVTVNDLGVYSLANMQLSVSRLEAQTTEGGARTTLQASQIELAANAMTLRSDDGLIEFSVSSLTMRASQLSFSFAQEQREQRVAQFSRRMDDLAARLGRPSDGRLRVSARALSLRFSASAAVSENALNGFEKGATILSARGNSLFAHFLVLFRTLLASSDEEASEFLEALNDFLDTMASIAEGNDEGVDVSAAAQQAVPPDSADGVRIFFEQIEMSYTRVEISAENSQPQQADPLVLDLDGNGVKLTDAENAQSFDMFGSGMPVSVAFPAAGDAFLAVDGNSNGRIDSGKELFGDQHGSPNGFAELARYDANLDGIIDRSDAVYEQLLLFGDHDGSGQVRPDELIPLHQAGISAISLRYDEVALALADGNRIAQSSQFVRDDGSTGEAADVVLRTFSALA